MGRPANALLVVGSPKASGSTSEALGRHLLEELGQRGVKTGACRLPPTFVSEDEERPLLAALEDTDLVVLSCPLYVDSLPSGVTRFLEIVAARREAETGRGEKRFVALLNCGFPEARQCDTAIAICRCFARKAGMQWSGGMALGGGGAIAGRPLSEAGGAARNAARALALAAEALADGRPVPADAVTVMAGKSMPSWLYVFGGNLGWRLRAARRGVLRRIHDRPFLR